MSIPSQSSLRAVAETLGRGSEPGRPTVEFTRAASALELACGADPSMARALHDVHIAVDAYGRILGLSPSVAARLGFPIGRLIGRRLQHRVIAADRTRFQLSLAPARSAQLPTAAEVRFRASDDRLVDAALTPLAIGKGGASIVIVFRVTLDDLADADGARTSRVVKCDPVPLAQVWPRSSGT